MPHKRRTTLLWLAAALLALWLLVGLTVSVSSSAHLTLDPATGEASATATVGRLRCRKELRGTLPFFAMSCTGDLH